MRAVRSACLTRVARRASAVASLTLATSCLVAVPPYEARAQAATVLFSQAPDYPGAFGAWTSSTPQQAAFRQGFETFDDFTLAQTASITGVTFRGMYIDLNTAANNPVAANTFFWGVTFATDAGGFPADRAVQLFPPALVTTTFVGQAQFLGSTVNLYDHAISLSQPYLAQAGTRYWFSPVSIQPDSGPVWAWTTGAVGSTGSGVSRQYQLTSTGRQYFAQRGDMAFTLSGVNAPEPGTFVLVAIGAMALLGVGVHRRR
jgi:hypothetical protein